VSIKSQYADEKSEPCCNNQGQNGVKCKNMPPFNRLTSIFHKYIPSSAQTYHSPLKKMLTMHKNGNTAPAVDLKSTGKCFEFFKK